MYGIKLLTILRVGLSHLREHKFRHNFQDTINLLCSCSLEIELISHFFLRCQNFTTPRTNLMNELRKIDSSILNVDEKSFTKLLLYGDSKFENKVNKKIFLASINFVLSTKRYVCLQFFFPLFVYILRFTLLYFMPHYMDFSKVMRSCF